MNELEFKSIWCQLYDWNKTSKESFALGIDLTKYDYQLYKLCIDLLKKIFGSDKTDLIIYSIFNDDKTITNEKGESIVIDSPELCWKYLNLID